MIPKTSPTSKITDSHSTATDATKIVIARAARLLEVTKIGLGPITHIGGGGIKRIKLSPVAAGIKATVRGGGTVQDLFIYTSEPSLVQKKLRDIF